MELLPCCLLRWVRSWPMSSSRIQSLGPLMLVSVPGSALGEVPCPQRVTLALPSVVSSPAGCLAAASLASVLGMKAAFLVPPSRQVLRRVCPTRLWPVSPSLLRPQHLPQMGCFP